MNMATIDDFLKLAISENEIAVVGGKLC